MIPLLNILFKINNPKYNDLKSSIEAQIEQIIVDAPLLAVKNISEYQFLGKVRIEIAEKCLPILQKSFLENVIQSRSFIRAMFESCVSNGIVNQWKEWLKKNIETISQIKNFQSNLISTLHNFHNPPQNAYILIFETVNIGFENFVFKKFINLFKNNEYFITSLERNEYLLRNFIYFQNFVSAKDINNVNINGIFAICSKLSKSRAKTSLFNQIFDRILMSDSSFDVMSQIRIGIYLLTKGSLKLQTAQKLCKKLENLNVSEGNFFISLLAYSVQNLDKIDQTTLSKFEKFYLMKKENLSNPNANIIINSLSTIISLPNEVISHDIDLIIKTLKDYLSQCSIHTFINFVRYLTPKYFIQNNESYKVIFKEVINAFVNFGPRMSIFDSLDCLKTFSLMRAKNPQIYNIIIENIGRNFNLLHSDDFENIVSSFSKTRMKQVDLIDKVLQKVQERNPGQMNFQIPYLCSDLFNFGYDSAYVKSEFLNFFGGLEIIKNNSNLSFLINFSLYTSILNLPNEDLILGVAVEKLIALLESKTRRKIFFNRNLSLLLNYLKFVKKNKPEWSENLTQSLKKSWENEDSFNENLNKIKINPGFFLNQVYLIL